MINRVVKYLKKHFEENNMKVDEAKANELVSRKWKNGCPMCGGKEWTLISENIFTPIMIENKTVQLSGTVIPTVPIVCRNCGMMIEVNGLVAGILKEEEKDNGTN